jgi:hypothetical protein
MPVAIHVSTKQKHEGWTAGHCVHCGQTEVMRVERHYRVVWIMFVPLSFSTAKKSLRCDFCERPADNIATTDEVPLDEWSAQEGVAALAGRLGRAQAFEGTSSNSDARLHSLLKSAQEATSLGKISAIPGVIAGLIIGFLAAASIGIVLFEAGIDLGSRDKFGVVMGFGLIGGVAGAILGALGYAWLSRGRLATAKIRAAHEKYNLDLRKLEELAQKYHARIWHGVKTVRDESLFGSSYGGFRAPSATSDFAEYR